MGELKWTAGVDKPFDWCPHDKGIFRRSDPNIARGGLTHGYSISFPAMPLKVPAHRSRIKDMKPWDKGGGAVTGVEDLIGGCAADIAQIGRGRVDSCTAVITAV